MRVFIKSEDSWLGCDSYLMKTGGTWEAISQSQALSYLTNNILFFGGRILPPAGTLQIGCSQTIVGETCTLTAFYDNTTDVTSAATWAITSGGTYATIDGSGTLTILSNANNSTITVFAEYNGVTATKDIVVTYKSGSSGSTEVETTTDESGNTTTTTTTVITNPDGSSASTSSVIVTDESGNTIGSSETNKNANADGSYNSTTTNYDGDGNPISGNNISGDTSGNVNTQSLAYNEQGESYVDGYTIDTSDNPNGGELISGGVDTGFIAFDGRPFTIHLKAKINTTEQKTNTNTLLSALENTSNNKYSGFAVDLYSRREIISFGGTNTQIKNTYFGSRITGTVGGSTGIQGLSYLHSGSQEISIDITYTPASLSPEWKYIICVQTLYTTASGGSKKSKKNSTMYSNSGYLPSSLDRATITIASYGVEHTHDAVNVEVLEFNVQKL